MHFYATNFLINVAPAQENLVWSVHHMLNIVLND